MSGCSAWCAQLKALLERATAELCTLASAFGEAAAAEEVSAGEAKVGLQQLEEIGNFLASLEKVRTQPSLAIA